MDTTSRNNIVQNLVNKVQGRTKQLHFLITSATTVHPPLLKWVGATIKVLAMLLGTVVPLVINKFRARKKPERGRAILGVQPSLT